jgi:purine nucleosidase
MVPVILDTDIGSDIDDAIALAYLLRQPRCELLGVTVATGHTVKRAALADCLCQAVGQSEIPIVAGLAGPVLTGHGQPEAPQIAALTNPRSDFNKDAVSFLRRAIRARPEEITLLTIGPLTNIAALFICDPEIPYLVKRIVSMAGTFGVTEHGNVRPNEWNITCDPVAAAIVFRHAKPGTLVSVGLDVTHACRLPYQEFHKRFSSSNPLHRMVLNMAEVWFQGNECVIFHDPLAAALIFHPELCSLEEGTIEVDLLSGGTKWMQSPHGPHQIAINVDAEKFFDDYFAVVG